MAEKRIEAQTRSEAQSRIDSVIRAALKEDLGPGDITVQLLVPPRLKGTGRIVVKKKGILCGLDVARKVFQKVDRRLEIDISAADGDRVDPGDSVMTIKGRVASQLKAERTALNFLQHLSGIATFTSRFVEATGGTAAKILDTRKTVPGLRVLEKAAVKAGGGVNHRMGLYDMILIKDNHLALFDKEDEINAVRLAVPRALKAAPSGVLVQVEVTSPEAALEAGKCGAQMILLDNMTPNKMAKTMTALQETFGKSRPLAEASGGVVLSNVEKIAKSGVDRISIGALTHSAAALDIAMYIRFDKQS